MVLSVSATELVVQEESNFNISVPKDVAFQSMTCSFYTYDNLTYLENVTGMTSDNPEINYIYIDLNNSTDDSVKSIDDYKNDLKKWGYTENESGENYIVYAHSDSDMFKYRIIVQDKGFMSQPENHFVIIDGNNLELLKEMANSVSFK